MCLQLSICLNILLHWDPRRCSYIHGTARTSCETNRNFRLRPLIYSSVKRWVEQVNKGLWWGEGSYKGARESIWAYFACVCPKILPAWIWDSCINHGPKMLLLSWCIISLWFWFRNLEQIRHLVSRALPFSHYSCNIACLSMQYDTFETNNLGC